MNSIEIDLNDPDFIQDPYPSYALWRKSAPFHYSEQWGMWFFLAHEDVNSLLRDRRLGRSIRHVLTDAEAGIQASPDWMEPFERIDQNSLMEKEPPDHTRLRALVHKAFTPRRVESLATRIRDICQGLIDEHLSAGQMDLIEDYAAPLPVHVIAELLGVPEEERAQLRPWSHDIVGMYELNATEEAARKAARASMEFSEAIKRLVEQRRQHPGDDLISALVQAESDGQRLSADELIATCILLLNAGHEATVNVIGNGMLALFRNPDQLERLKGDPGLISTAIEEMLRYDTPLQLFKRWVLEDMEYKGVRFKQGTRAALLFGAGNRDPERFERPDDFDIERRDNAHLSFGGGIHYCLGAPLARLELKIAIPMLISRLPNLRLLDPAPAFRDTFVIRGLKSLQVGFS